jgi:hypothetical protein
VESSTIIGGKSVVLIRFNFTSLYGRSISEIMSPDTQQSLAGNLDHCWRKPLGSVFERFFSGKLDEEQLAARYCRSGQSLASLWVTLESYENDPPRDLLNPQASGAARALALAAAVDKALSAAFFCPSHQVSSPSLRFPRFFPFISRSSANRRRVPSLSYIGS